MVLGGRILMSEDVTVKAAKFMLEMGLDAEATLSVVEMLDAFEALCRGNLAQELSNTIYDEGYYPEPHWKIFAQGFEAGIAKAIEVVERQK